MSGFSDLVWTVFSYTLPSKIYLSFKYRVIFHKRLDWKHPVCFTEKLQWLKLYGFQKEYVRMVDKVLVKEYIAGKLGAEYVIPTLGVWKSADDIDINALPEQFVLKCNHDSGTAVVCRDKGTLNVCKTVATIRKALKRNYYLMGRETPYKYVKRRVFAEQYIENADGTELVDYKFFCFNGEPKITKVDFGRGTRHQANYYDVDMNLLPFGVIASHPDYSRHFDKPENYEEMLGIARKLSDGIPFVRVDLYNVNGKIYFGELTFFPTSGLQPFTDTEWDRRLGGWIVLPDKKYADE